MKASTGIMIALFALTVGCGPKFKEIPMETMADISIQAKEAGNSVPEETPMEKLDAYAKPFGFTGEDFKQNMLAIKKDPQKKRQFDEMEFALILKNVNKKLEPQDSTKNKWRAIF